MAELEARRAAPHQTFGYTTPEGEQREISADASGLVRPKNADDVRILDGFDLPVARTTSRPAAKRSAKKSSRSSTKTTRAATPAPEPAQTDTKGPGHPDAGGDD